MDYKINDSVLSKFKELLENLKNHSSVLAIEGNSSFRKTYTLSQIEQFLSTNNKEHQIKFSHIDCNDEFGISEVSYTRPLSIIKKAIEDLENDNTKTKFNFYKNIALTVSTMIPILGEFTFTGKELIKDIKEYNKSKKVSINKIEEELINDAFNKLQEVTKNKQSIIFLDNFEQADQLSIKFVHEFSRNCLQNSNRKLKNVMIVFTFNKHLVKQKGFSLMSLINANEEDNLFGVVELKAFNKDQINQIALKEGIPFYKKNDEFLNWIYDKTIGVPGDILKYIEHFKKDSPFDQNSMLKSEFSKTDYIPDTLQRNFSTTLDSLDENERNILTTASAFGNEFSVSLLKDILNTDSLTLIRKLRNIYIKTNIINSLGAFKQFGVKTTIYKFTQGYYQKYFYSLAEHEEKLNIHSLIQQTYQKIYDNTDDEEIKKEVTAKIAIHSKEAEDFETSKRMFLQTAKIAASEGDKDALEAAKEQIYQIENYPNSGLPFDHTSFNNLIDKFSNTDYESLKNSVFTNDTEILFKNGTEEKIASEFTEFDFKTERNDILNLYHTKDFRNAISKINDIFQSYEEILDNSEKVQLLCLALNSMSASEDVEDNYLFKNKSSDLFKSKELDLISKCMLSNSLANFYYQKNNKDEAKKLLLDAAKKSLKLPLELKLLTLSNIYKMNFYKENEKDDIFNTIDIYTKKLRFNEFRNDLGLFN